MRAALLARKAATIDQSADRDDLPRRKSVEELAAVPLLRPGALDCADRWYVTCAAGCICARRSTLARAMLGLKPGVLDQVHRHIHHITSHHITEPHRHTANDVASGHHHITSSIHRPIAHTTQAIHHTCLPTLIPECRPRHPPPLLVSLCHLFGCRRLVVVIVIVCCCAGRGGVWLGVCLRGGSVSCSGTCVCDCGCGCVCVCVCVTRLSTSVSFSYWRTSTCYLCHLFASQIES